MGLSLNWSAKFQKPSSGYFKNIKVVIGFPTLYKFQHFERDHIPTGTFFQKKKFPSQKNNRPRPLRQFRQVTRRPAAVKVTKRFTAPQWLRSYSWPKANMAKPWLVGRPVVWWWKTRGLMVWPVVWLFDPWFDGLTPGKQRSQTLFSKNCWLLGWIFRNQ